MCLHSEKQLACPSFTLLSPQFYSTSVLALWQKIERAGE